MGDWVPVGNSKSFLSNENNNVGNTKDLESDGEEDEEMASLNQKGDDENESNDDEEDSQSDDEETVEFNPTFKSDLADLNQDAQNLLDNNNEFYDNANKKRKINEGDETKVEK